MKFSGVVGFWKEDEEYRPGVWKPVMEERPYYGEIHRHYRQNQEASNQQNPNLVLNVQISILSDLYARQNWSNIRYVVWNGSKWKVKTVNVTYPRLELEIGGVYNGP